MRLTSLERMDEEELEDEDLTDALSANTDPFTRQLLLSEARARAADRLTRRAARKAAAAAAAAEAASQEGPQASAPEGAREAAQPEGRPADRQGLAAAPGRRADRHQLPCAECAARQAAAGGDGDAQACACRPQQPAEAAAGSAAVGGQSHAGVGEAAARSGSTAGPVGVSNTTKPSTKPSSEAAKDGGTAHTTAECGEADPGSSSNSGLMSGPGSLSGSGAAKCGEAARGEAAGPSTPPGSMEPSTRRRSRQQPGRSALVSLQRKASKGYCVHRWVLTFCGAGRCAGGTVAAAAAAAQTSRSASLWRRSVLLVVCHGDGCPQ